MITYGMRTQVVCAILNLAQSSFFIHFLNAKDPVMDTGNPRRWKTWHPEVSHQSLDTWLDCDVGEKYSGKLLRFWELFVTAARGIILADTRME